MQIDGTQYIKKINNCYNIIINCMYKNMFFDILWKKGQCMNTCFASKNTFFLVNYYIL